MLTNYIVVEKSALRYGSSSVRVVQGTNMSISKGQLQIWNSDREGVHGHRPVLSVPVERIISFKEQAKTVDGVVDTPLSQTAPHLRLQPPSDGQTQVA